MYGTDGDQDGRVDLAGAHDAIMSIGTYLKKNGWRPGLNRDQQINVILKYNKSLPYARTVLDLGNRLQ
jgi:membrane-bound lytic murein transglycosylase B